MTYRLPDHAPQSECRAADLRASRSVSRPRWARSRASPIGTCVARSTRVEEDGFAGGPFVGCAGGPLP